MDNGKPDHYGKYAPSNQNKVDAYIHLIHGKSAHAELMKSEVYVALFNKAILLIESGHEPFAVAIALARLTSVILEGIDDCLRKRPS